MRSSNAHITMHRHSGVLWEVEACSVFTSVHSAVWNCDREEATSNVQRNGNKQHGSEGCTQQSHGSLFRASVLSSRHGL
jgi:hypothetical protein